MPRAQEIESRHLSAIVAINNAWRVRDDWTHCVHPGDFPEDRRPMPTKGQSLVSHRDYVPANNRYGGIIYAGATMAFSAAYWVLHALRPDVMAFCGCDMIYDRPSGCDALLRIRRGGPAARRSDPAEPRGESEPAAAACRVPGLPLRQPFRGGSKPPHLPAARRRPARPGPGRTSRGHARSGAIGLRHRPYGVRPRHGRPPPAISSRAETTGTT